MKIGNGAAESSKGATLLEVPWTRIRTVIRNFFFPDSDLKISRKHGIGFVADLYWFFALQNGLKNIRIRCRIPRMCVDERRIRKEKVADSKNIWILVDGALIAGECWLFKYQPMRWFIVLYLWKVSVWVNIAVFAFFYSIIFRFNRRLGIFDNVSLMGA